MMSDLAALILGVVEGFTEFLPISSTAHLILASRLLGVAQSEFAKTFEIAIQSGAILAVVVLYWRKFLDWDVLKKVAAAFVPTGIIGLAAYSFVKNYLLEDISVVLWALGIGGALLIIFERWKRRVSINAAAGAPSGASVALPTAGEAITYKKAVGIGVFQAVAVIPGVSRAAATIVGGMLLGIGRAQIVEFSFLLAVPTMLAATGLDLVRNANAFSSSEVGTLAIGMVVSFLAATLSIKFLLRYIKTHDFTGFGIYRILLALLFLLLFT